VAKEKNRRKRVVILSDTHCGHLAGLTPPRWQGRFAAPGDESKDQKIEAVQRACWDWYAKTLASLQPIDILVFNGDAIDGRGDRSGGTELISTDRIVQMEMALAVIREAKAKHHLLTIGTGYHTGNEEDWEVQIAQRLGAKVGSHEWLDVNGLIFDFKHHLGSSSVPHGRHTASARDRLWNLLWSVNDEQPRAQVFIRSHVHYHTYCGGRNWLSMTTPALQAAGTKYGARRCSGTVDFGFVHFDVDTDGSYQWQAHLADLQAQKAQPCKL
jgi:hypothetical protein